MNIVKSEAVKYHHRQLHKFGGSSLANVKSYQRVANIMINYSQPGDLMVVSSAGTTTNQLINWLNLSQTDRILANQVQKTISSYQQNLIIGLLPSKKAKVLKLDFLADFDRLNKLVDEQFYDDIYAEIVGHGEIWSARLMSSVLEEFGLPNHWLDARLFLRAEFSAQPQVDETLSLPLLKELLKKYPNKLLVVTGFIARNKKGKTVLLGRNGSDYSATQVGALAGVNKITIWSDVAGIYSADPHKVKDAYLLPLLRFDEAIELARLSVSVLHTRTLQPIYDTNIDLQLKCSYQPEQGSTKIQRILESKNGARIVISHDDVYLIELNLENEQNFNQFYKDIDLLLKSKQLQPLASGLHPDKKLIQLCYTPEIASSVLNILKDIFMVKRLSLSCDCFSLFALVGAGVRKNPLHNYFFYKELKDQPVEFIWYSEKEISIVAVLRSTKTSNLVQRLHKKLFQVKKRIRFILFNRYDMRFCWIKLSLINQKNISIIINYFKFIFKCVVNNYYSSGYLNHFNIRFN